MKKYNLPDESRPNPFATLPPAGKGPDSGPLEAMMAAHQRRIRWLTLGFILFSLALVAADYWIMQLLFQREREQMLQSKETIVEQARKFRNELNNAERMLQQTLLDAHAHQRMLQNLTSNANRLFAQIMTNELTTAEAARVTGPPAAAPRKTPWPSGAPSATPAIRKTACETGSTAPALNLPPSRATSPPPTPRS